MRPIMIPSFISIFKTNVTILQYTYPMPDYAFELIVPYGTYLALLVLYQFGDCSDSI